MISKNQGIGISGSGAGWVDLRPQVTYQGGNVEWEVRIFKEEMIPWRTP